MHNFAGGDGLALLHRDYVEIIETWAKEHDLETQDIESLHHALKIAISGEASVHNVSTRGTLKQSQRAVEAMRQSKVPPTLVKKTKKKTLALSDEHCWFRYCRSRDKLLGASKGRITKETWANYRREWGELDEDTQCEHLRVWAAERSARAARQPIALASQDQHETSGSLVQRFGGERDYRHWGNAGSSDYRVTPDGGTIALAKPVLAEHMTDMKSLDEEWRSKGSMLACDKGAIPKNFVSTQRVPVVSSVFRKGLLSALKRAFKAAGGQKAASELSVLVAVHVGHQLPFESESHTENFLAIVADCYGSSALGAQEASALLLPLAHADFQQHLDEIIEINGMRGLELRFARQEFIEPHVEHCDHYSKGVTSGKVDVRELDDWVGDIVRLEGSVAFMQVCLYEFKWSRRRMDELVVTDVSTTPGCMLLRVDMQKKAGRRKRKNDSADSGSDFDWLEAPKPDLPAEEASVLVFQDGQEDVPLEQALSDVIDQELREGAELPHYAALARAFEEEQGEPAGDEEEEEEEHDDASVSDASQDAEDGDGGMVADHDMHLTGMGRMVADHDMHLFARDPRQLSDELLHWDTSSGKVYEKCEVTGLPGRLLGLTKFVGLHSIRVYCKLHTCEKCGFIVYGAGKWEAAAECLCRV